MSLSNFTIKDGRYVLEGCHYDNAEQLIQSGILGFCECGIPDRNLKYILGGLRLINEKGPSDLYEWKQWWVSHQSKISAHFGTKEAEYFFYYWADKEELTEHGGSVPGWLTSSGDDLLQMLEEWEMAQPGAIT